MDARKHNPPHTASLEWFREQAGVLGPQAAFYGEYATLVEQLCKKAHGKDNPVVPFLLCAPYLHEVARPVYEKDGALNKQKTLLVNLPAWLDDLVWMKTHRGNAVPLHMKPRQHYLHHNNMLTPHGNLAETLPVSGKVQRLLNKAAPDSMEKERAIWARYISESALAKCRNYNRAYNAESDSANYDRQPSFLFAPHRLFIQGISYTGTPPLKGEALSHMASFHGENVEIENFIVRKLRPILEAHALESRGYKPLSDVLAGLEKRERDITVRKIAARLQEAGPDKPIHYHGEFSAGSFVQIGKIADESNIYASGPAAGKLKKIHFSAERTEFPETAALPPGAATSKDWRALLEAAEAKSKIPGRKPQGRPIG